MTDPASMFHALKRRVAERRATDLRGSPPKEKGGAPEDARQKDKSMQGVLEMPAASKKPRTIQSVNSPDRNASLWLDDQIARSQAGIITAHVELTPALARVLLARNPDNRKVSDLTVGRYVRDILNDAWSDNGQTIVVSKSGSLNDGQHRCEAVIAADKAITTILVIGTDRDSRFTLDQGKTRLVADYLAMNGHVDGAALGACAGFYWQYNTYGRVTSQPIYKATKGEILDTIEVYPGLAKSLSLVTKKGIDMVGGRSVLAFCHFAFTNKAGEEAATRFTDQYISGENLNAGHPILHVRNKMVEKRGRLKLSEKVEYIFRAWNAQRRGETQRTLFRLSGDLPKLER